MVSVWRIRGKVIRGVLCCIECCSCVLLYTHTCEHFTGVLEFVSFESDSVFAVCLSCS